jgi:hypothetical protein
MKSIIVLGFCEILRTIKDSDCDINLSLRLRPQPRTQALSTTRLAGGPAGHLSPTFWEITIGTYGGREGKCGVRVQNSARSVNKATQRTTVKLS